MSSMDITSSKQQGDEDDQVPLPGFRFYPTDEELVGFYLRRKVEKRPISIELIKQIDIYKHDPWDLPQTSTVGDNEWYFFCKRGRKYKNSVRPNRVTGSGFWKATGIDKPVCSAEGEGRTNCIGLKKSLVYYRGNAGKGTKTDWMMHEFRLPDPPNAKNNTQEAEVWTLCRIFKRNVSYRKYTANWREIATKSRNPTTDTTSSSTNTCSTESANREGYISFGNDPVVVPQNGPKKPVVIASQISSSSITQPQPFLADPSSSSVSFSNLQDGNEFFIHENWDELRSVLDFSVYPSSL